MARRVASLILFLVGACFLGCDSGGDPVNPGASEEAGGFGGDLLGGAGIPGRAGAAGAPGGGLIPGTPNAIGGDAGALNTAAPVSAVSVRRLPGGIRVLHLPDREIHGDDVSHPVSVAEVNPWRGGCCGLVRRGGLE